jgi:hypothetical protein
MITKSDLVLHEGDDVEFHALLVRNELNLPDVKSKSSTLGWLYKGLRGTLGCPSRMLSTVCRFQKRLGVTFFSDTYLNSWRLLKFRSISKRHTE